MRSTRILLLISGGFSFAGLAGVPENLAVPVDQSLSLAVSAAGVQIYECKAGKDAAARFEWAFKAPEAELFDRAGNRIGKHYGGPTWEANDGSKVVGEAVARAESPDATAIPWLLLKAKTTSGSGVFARTRSIQRVDTAGGKAPIEGCDQARIGAEVRVPYKAAYYFFDASRP